MYTLLYDRFSEHSPPLAYSTDTMERPVASFDAVRDYGQFWLHLRQLVAYALWRYVEKNFNHARQSNRMKWLAALSSVDTHEGVTAELASTLLPSSNGDLQKALRHHVYSDAWGHIGCVLLHEVHTTPCYDFTLQSIGIPGVEHDAADVGFSWGEVLMQFGCGGWSAPVDQRLAEYNVLLNCLGLYQPPTSAPDCIPKMFRHLHGTLCGSEERMLKFFEDFLESTDVLFERTERYWDEDIPMHCDHRMASELCCVERQELTGTPELRQFIRDVQQAVQAG